ncbi:uncharacterized protein LOC126812520 [Patella vulgata]|uniref:uncharacterized protein LOC126812520 n=1 Tax=Patella vulgata TaxID=6465 RepID=UPI00217F8759|nr:uncharacterized protein LOC126812520 [Patella vulgata]
MVRKVLKGGVSTGNTVRSNPSRHYASQSGITFLTSETTSAHIKQEFEEANFLGFDGIFYSLNKKGRWLLPELIKEEIETSLTKLKCSVALIESHKLNKENNCLGYYTNKGRTKTVIPKKGKYINRPNEKKLNGAQNKTESKKRRRLRGNNSGQEEQTTVDADVPLLVYDVVYPCPAHSSIVSNPKFIKNESDHSLIKHKIKHCRNQRRFLEDITSVEDELEFIQDVSDADDAVSYEDEIYMNTGTRSEICDFLTHSLDRNVNIDKSKQRKLRSGLKCQKKTNDEGRLKHLKRRPIRVEYTPNLSVFDAENESIEINIPNLPSPEYIPVDIILPKHQVESCYLLEHFPKVVFAECSPRKFIIDITEGIKEQLKHTKPFKRTILQKFDLTSFVVFAFKKIYDDHHDIYSVHLNIPTHTSTVRIETLFDMMLTDMDDVLNRCVLYFETMSPESFHTKDILDLTYTPLVQYDIIRPFVQKTVNCVYPESMVLTERSYDVDAVDFEWIMIDDDQEERCCNICFEDISSNSTLSSTSLRCCGHWFCDGCWREHLLNNFRAGLQKCLCPEYDCDKEVDDWTMVTLVNIRDIKRRQTRNITVNLTTSNSSKWCPNKRCGRIIQNLSCSGSTILCKCGIEVCFNCMREGHWPATCEQFSTYERKLRAYNGIDCTTIPVVRVRGKHCPQCNNFIVKNGGCPNMMCICGTCFCWSCGRKSSEHRMYCKPSGRNLGTVLRDVRHIERELAGAEPKSNMYMMAVKCRMYRRPSHIKGFKKKSEQFKSRIKSWLKKQNNETLGMNSIDDLFTDIVNIKTELNFVSEFCFVAAACEENKNILKCFQRAASRLQTLGDNISDSLVISISPDFRKMLSELMSLRDRSRTAILSVVTLMSRIQRNSVSAQQH